MSYMGKGGQCCYQLREMQDRISGVKIECLEYTDSRPYYPSGLSREESAP